MVELACCCGVTRGVRIAGRLTVVRGVVARSLGSCARLLGVVVLAGALLVLVGVRSAEALPANCTGVAVVSCTFASTGAEQSFVVPAGVSSVHVVARGAPGGRGASLDSSPSPGGRGAAVSGDLSVTAAEVLYVEVGGAPTFDADACYPGLGGVPCVGGFNGGGSSHFGGGGGGASDVRTVTGSDAGTLASRVLVAGGGGGGGEFCLSSGLAGGGAGGNAGAKGGDGPNCGVAGGTGGGAGTANAGGAGGSPFGHAGGLGVGGAGGLDTGGGGGGGLYGGGGGGDITFGDTSESTGGAGGGGGGSSLLPAGGLGRHRPDRHPGRGDQLRPAGGGACDHERGGGDVHGRRPRHLHGDDDGRSAPVSHRDRRAPRWGRFR